MNGGTMQIEQPLGKDRDGNDAAREDRPHKQAALLDVVDHRPVFLAAFRSRGKPRSPRLFSFARRRWALRNTRRRPEHLARGIVNGVAGLPAILVVGVNDSVAHGVVGPELDLLGQLSGSVVLI